MKTTLSLLFYTAAIAVIVATKGTVVADSTSSTTTSTSSSDNGVNTKRKNIIFYMTDDQDVTANSIDPKVMPKLNQYFREGGKEFTHYYVTTALCCPSRATIFRGQYCHNHKVFDNGQFNNRTHKSGGYSAFRILEDETMATLLQADGYETALVGKYINGYGNWVAEHTPPGWDHWMGMLGMFDFYGPSFSENGKTVKTGDDVYQTDFMRDWALDFLRNKRDPDKPFFLVVTPVAPHAPAVPAKRHEHLFQDARAPRTKAFNPSDDALHQQNKPTWIKNMPPLTEEQTKEIDAFYANRLRSLQAVDEAIESIVGALDTLGLSDDTYFIYTSDNGQHFGDHRMPAGKRQAYETDVLVPFFIRGPGIQKGSKLSQVVQSVDLAPTFLDIASSSSLPQNLPVGSMRNSATAKASRRLMSTYPMDGKSFLPLLTPNGSQETKNKSFNNFRWAALLEMYGSSSNTGRRYKNIPGYYKNHLYPNTYQALRVIDGPPGGYFHGENLLYVEWCTGEQELYNMTTDPHQVHNLIHDSDYSHSHIRMVNRMSQILSQFGDCEGSDCYIIKAENFQDHGSNSTISIMADAEMGIPSFLSFEQLQSSIRRRIPCHNPPNTTSPNYRRRPFAYDKPVPEPFQDGFPFSDGDVVDEDLLRVWQQYHHYFY